MATVTTACVSNLLRTMRAQLELLTLRLAKADWAPTRLTELADLQEATFPGYGPIKMVGWGAVFLTAQEAAESDLPIFRFRSGAVPAPPESVYGWFVTNSDMRVYISGKRTGGPLALVRPNMEYAIAPYVTLSAGPGSG